MDISFIIIVLSLIAGIGSAIFAISTIIKTRNKYYKDFLFRKGQSHNLLVKNKESRDIIENNNKEK